MLTFLPQVGIVHQAPAFGEDDYNIAVEVGYLRGKPPPDPLDDSGHFTDKVKDFAGMHVKDADKHIVQHLKAAGRLVVQSTLRHSYRKFGNRDFDLAVVRNAARQRGCTNILV